MSDCDVCTYEIAHDNAGVCCDCTAILHAERLNLQSEHERMREARDAAERALALYADDRNEWRTEAERLAVRVLALEARQQELLQAIRRLSAEAPYPEEADSVATLIAEVGTLRHVYKAAQAFDKLHRGQHSNGADHTLAVRNARNALHYAIDAAGAIESKP